MSIVVKCRGWALLKRVQGIGDAEDYKFNYFWVHAFDNIEQMVAHTKRIHFGINLKINLVSNQTSLKVMDPKKVGCIIL